MPVYKGKTPQDTFTFHEFRLNECPTSVVTPRSRQLVEIWFLAQRSKVPFGQLLEQEDEERPSQREAWIEDVDDLLRIEQNRVDVARQKHQDRLAGR